MPYGYGWDAGVELVRRCVGWMDAPRLFDGGPASGTPDGGFADD
jgi:hypothetical protein